MVVDEKGADAADGTSVIKPNRQPTIYYFTSESSCKLRFTFKQTCFRYRKAKALS